MKNRNSGTLKSWRNFLPRVSEVLVADCDEDELLRRVAELIVTVPAGSAWSVIDRFHQGKLERVAVHTARKSDRKNAELFAELTPNPKMKSLKNAVFHPGRLKSPARFVAGSKNPQAEKIAAKIGISSLISVPIRGRHGTYGTMTSMLTKNFYDSINLDNAKDLGRRIGVAIEDKRLRVALVDAERKFRRLFDDNLIGIFISDSRGQIYEANDEYLRLTGWSRADVLDGRARWDTITVPEELGFCLRNAEAAEIAANVPRYEKTYILKDGTRVPVLIGYSRLDDATDRLVGYAVDLSKQKQLEKELRHAVQAREDFLSIASHELKTPLTSLLMQVHLLRHMGRSGGINGLNEPKFLQKLDSVQRHVGQLAVLVDSLLDVSRVRNDRLTLLPTRVDICALLRDLVDRFAENARQSGVKLSLVAPQKTYGIWDRMRIEQVLSNLISNALKYGRGQPVEVRLRSDRERCLIQVRDRGIGIDKKDHQRVFDRFERAASNNYGGLGLGLYITQKIVDSHGGRIWVESRAGAGATFFVELPRERLGRLRGSPLRNKTVRLVNANVVDQ